MNLNPANQLSLYVHYTEFSNFIELYKNKKMPNKILLSGEKGIGKSTLAYHIINYILSYDEDFPYDLKNFNINPDNKSFKLITNKSNPNFILVNIEEDKKSIDINQIRNLILTLNKSSFNIKPRLVLIDNIDLLNINSINTNTLVALHYCNNKSSLCHQTILHVSAHGQPHVQQTHGMGRQCVS